MNPAGLNLPIKVLARLVAAEQPPPLPDNSPLNQFVGPNDTATWTDSITVTLAPNGRYYTPYTSRIGGQGDWQSGTATNVSTTLAPGSIVLAANQTTGNLITPSRQIPFVPSGAQMTVTWDSYLFSGTSVTVQIRWSSDGVSWGPWSAPLTSGGAVAVSASWYQFLVTLTTNNVALSPRVNTLTITMPNAAIWGGMLWT